MTDFAYGPADEDEATATIHCALDLGVTFLDTADIYGLTEPRPPTPIRRGRVP